MPSRLATVRIENEYYELHEILLECVLECGENVPSDLIYPLIFSS